MAKITKRALRLPKPWTVTLKKSKRSGYIDNSRTWRSQSFICYDDGTAAFDRPASLPKTVKERIARYCERFVE